MKKNNLVICAKIQDSLVEDIIEAPEIRVLNLMFPEALIVDISLFDGEPFIGGYFLEDRFVSPCPHNGWILDKNKKAWIPPIDYPRDEKKYFWNNSIENWQELPYSKILSHD
jgi:hypothetical protein